MNLHDIAREAGVSTATVSRVINNSSLVVDETRRRVQAVIDKYNYTPNALARGLIQNSTKTIGVLTVDIRMHYFSTVVHSVERELRALGYNIFLCNTGGDKDEKIHYIKALLEKKVDGLVFVGSIYKEKGDNHHIIDASKRVPLVLLNNHIKGDNIFCILCDDFKGVYDATKYLIDKNHMNIMYIHSSSTFSGLSKRKGYLSAMKEAGILANRRIIDVEFIGGDDIAQTLKKEYEKCPFDGLVSSDDTFCNIAINKFHEMGIKVPEDVAAIGYNNSIICDYTYPPLSTVDSRMTDLGAKGGRLMDCILKGSLPEKRISFLSPELIIRKSC